jgi:hypothetical protein
MSSFDLYKIAAFHILYLALAGIGVWTLLRHAGADLAITETVICALPAVLGVVLASTSTSDEEQYVVRLMAAAALVPILLLFWSTSAGAPTGYVLGIGLLHLLLFAGSVLWIGPKATRVSAASGVTPAAAATLQARLLSLGAIGGPLLVSSPASDEVVVTFRYRSPERSYRVLLKLDSIARQARVRERASANMAKPSKDSEKSMRGPVEPYFDPTRPEATAISETVAQLTPIRKAELDAVPATWQGQAVAVPAEFAAALDERGLATLLCAVVTRSGWDWQPVFFGAQ